MSELRADAIRYCNDPVGYLVEGFGSIACSHSIPRRERAALQLEVLKIRFESLREQIPILHRLSSNQDIARLELSEYAHKVRWTF